MKEAIGGQVTLRLSQVAVSTSVNASMNADVGTNVSANASKLLNILAECEQGQALNVALVC